MKGLSLIGLALVLVGILILVISIIRAKPINSIAVFVGMLFVIWGVVLIVFGM